jgi:hypothetical protein
LKVPIGGRARENRADYVTNYNILVQLVKDYFK